MGLRAALRDLSRRRPQGNRRASARRNRVQRAMERQDARAVLRLCPLADAAGRGRLAQGSGLRQRRRLHPVAERAAGRHAEADDPLADEPRDGALRRADRRRSGQLRSHCLGEHRRADRQRRSSHDQPADAGRARCCGRGHRQLADVQQGLSRRTVLEPRARQHGDREEPSRGVHVPARRTRHVLERTGRVRRLAVRDDPSRHLRDRRDDLREASGRITTSRSVPR